MPGARIDSLEATACTISTDRPESDGTLEWYRTTAVLVEIRSGNVSGIGMTYAHAGIVPLIRETLASRLRGHEISEIPRLWEMMLRSVRNIGRPGMAMMAISAVDFALWDLKAKLMNISLIDLLGGARAAIPVYGSGGFTSYPIPVLEQQLSNWVEKGIAWVKMKVGREPSLDPERVRAARKAIGPQAGLFVDANGAYTVPQAVELANRFSEEGVTWLEEPVPQDDVHGLFEIRSRAPFGMEVAAGEYGQELRTFRYLLSSRAVDVLQIDATRCGGITGFMKAAALAESFGIPISTHTAPSMHAAVACAVSGVRHVEYFHDHVRIEEMLFDSAIRLENGRLRPDRTRPGFGLELKRDEIRRRLA